MDRRTSLSLLTVGLATAGVSTAASAEDTAGIKLMVLYHFAFKASEVAAHCRP